MEKLLKFNAIIETCDIQEAFAMELPEMSASDVVDSSSDDKPKMNEIVQFMLYKVGNPIIENKYK